MVWLTLIGKHQTVKLKLKVINLCIFCLVTFLSFQSSIQQIPVFNEFRTKKLSWTQIELFFFTGLINKSALQLEIEE